MGRIGLLPVCAADPVGNRRRGPLVYEEGLESMLTDIRYAFRWLRRAPAVTLIAILSIAIGAGATAVVFAAVKAVLIEPFPYSHPEALVQIRTDTGRGASPRQDWVSWDDMRDVARENRSFTALGTYHYALFNLGGDPGSLPEALYGLYISASLFPTLGARPMLGRNILPEETQPGRDREMILSYDLWLRRFRADPAVVGRAVEVNGHDCRIIGVMPAGFDFPMRLATTVSTPSRHMDFWAPEAVDPARTHRGSTGYGAIARLRPGTSLAEARQDLSAIAARLASAYPRTNENRTLRAGWLRDRTLGFAQTGLLLLMAAALVFLLIGCANVANLLLARTLARRGEMALRAALGAGRWRIVRQLVTESSVLAVLGGLAGYALAALAWRLLPAVTPMSIPRLAAARADGTVFAFALVVSAFTGIAAGLAPAWRACVIDLAGALRESGARATVGTSHHRLRSLLLLSEIVVTVVLLVIGGALAASFVRLLRTDPGFDADHALASIIVASGDRYLNHPEAQTLLFRRILDSVRALPGVESAGTVHPLPFSGDNNGGWVTATEAGVARPETQSIAEVDTVSAGYLETMGVPLLQGRWFREEEMDPARQLAIVNDLAAARLWPGGNAIGSRICVNCAPDRPASWKQVIGVAGGIRHAALDQPPGMEVYLSAGALSSADFLVVRSHRPFAALGQAIRRAVAAIDPKQPVFLSAGMSTLIGDSLSDHRFIVTLLAITGCLALLLSAAGVYGVVSYVTSRRTEEIGVRVALGATPRQVHTLVFRQGMRLAVLGIAIGLPAAMAVERVLRHWVAGLEADDPALIAMAAALVAMAAAVACWIPAWRATRIDPIVALRQE
jgi:predicted permease